MAPDRVERSTAKVHREPLGRRSTAAHLTTIRRNALTPFIDFLPRHGESAGIAQVVSDICAHPAAFLSGAPWQIRYLYLTLADWCERSEARLARWRQERSTGGECSFLGAYEGVLKVVNGDIAPYDGPAKREAVTDYITRCCRVYVLVRVDNVKEREKQMEAMLQIERISKGQKSAEAKETPTGEEVDQLAGLFGGVHVENQAQETEDLLEGFSLGDSSNDDGT